MPRDEQFRARHSEPESGSGKIGEEAMKGRRIHGVLIADYGMLRYRVNQATQWSRDADKAPGLMFSAFISALDSARRDRLGFGWSSCSDVLSAITLDESGRRLLHAEFYVLEGEYRDEELFREAEP